MSRQLEMILKSYVQSQLHMGGGGGRGVGVGLGEGGIEDNSKIIFLIS